MIAVREGQEHILAQIAGPVPPEVLPVPRALARVLADDVQAPFDVPPADNSAVDGYAVGSADIPDAGTRELDVVGDLAAGAVFTGALRPGQALRIMTGAPMPAGADTVYPQEIVERVGDARARSRPIAKGVNVRMRGEDVEAGGIVIEARHRAAAAGARARSPRSASGRSACIAAPRVALLSTGDEVAEPGTPRQPGQIYDANRFTLRGSIEQCGGEVLDLGIVPDVRDDAARAAAGGQPRWPTSWSPPAASRSASTTSSRTCSARSARSTSGRWPCSPAGRWPSAASARRTFFGLPGNPVASLLAFMLFVRPALCKLAGRRRVCPRRRGRRARPSRCARGRPPRVQARRPRPTATARWEVRTTGPQGSGILSSMVAGNCLIVLEEDRGDVAAGRDGARRAVRRAPVRSA